MKCTCTIGTCEFSVELSGQRVISHSWPSGVLHLSLVKTGIYNGMLGKRDALLKSLLRHILNVPIDIYLRLALYLISKVFSKCF